MDRSWHSHFQQVLGAFLRHYGATEIIVAARKLGHQVKKFLKIFEKVCKYRLARLTIYHWKASKAFLRP